MSTSHTPGPWKLRMGKLFSGAQYTQAVVGPDGQSIRVSAMTLSSGPECDANARLIAAAPELLEALQVLVRCYEHDGIPNDTEGYVQNAREAIAKATSAAGAAPEVQPAPDVAEAAKQSEQK